MGCFGCFGEGMKSKEKGPSEVSDKLHPLEAAENTHSSARRRAAEAAQKRQDEFAKSSAGKAARAQMDAMAKRTANTNNHRGEPALKWQMG